MHVCSIELGDGDAIEFENRKIASFETIQRLSLELYKTPVRLFRSIHSFPPAVVLPLKYTGLTRHGGWAEAVAAAAEAAASGGFWRGEATDEQDDKRASHSPPSEVRMAWRECEQLSSAISKNNEIKRKISRRLRNNSRQAEKLKSNLDGKVIRGQY